MILLMIYTVAGISMKASSSGSLRGPLVSRAVKLRGGEYSLERTRRKDVADPKEDEEIYVSLQFEPFRALVDVTRRVGRVLGMALRRLSRAFTGSASSSKSSSGRRKKRRANKKSTIGEDAQFYGPMTTASVNKISKIARRRGLAIAIIVSHDPSVIDTVTRIASELRNQSLMIWETDFRSALDWVSSALGGQRRSSTTALIAIAFPAAEDDPISMKLRALSVRTATDKTVHNLFSETSLVSWLSRCFETHATEFAQLDFIRKENALALEQKTERRVALEQEHSAEIQAQIAAQAKELQLAKEAEEKKQAEATKKRRELAAQNLPAEPPASNKDAITIALRDPAGKRHSRRFAPPDATTDKLADWVDALLHIDLQSQFRLRLVPNGPDLNDIFNLNPPLNLLEIDASSAKKKRLLFECLPISTMEEE